MTKVELQKEITLYDLYYEQGRPLISDTEYEKKLAELRRLEETTGADENSPTQIIPFIKVEGLETVKHNSPILSMEKVTTYSDLSKWYKEGEGILIEPKLDGCTVVLRFSDGTLTEALTRGTGLEGERVLHTVQTIKNLPQTIPYKGNLEVRGEVFIPFKTFDEINNGEYANPRSMAAGTIRLLDANKAAQRGLDILIFDIIGCDIKFETAVQQYHFLLNLQFPVVPFQLFFDFPPIENFIKNYGETRSELPFPIDGVCLKYNMLSLRETMGSRGKSERWNIAFKYPSQEEFTYLRDVSWQVGKSGQLSPVASFDSIYIDGVEISKATLHNYEFIQEKQIAINSKIVVARANDVIPKVICAYLSDDTIPITYPETCPACGTPTQFTGPNLYCVNPKCHERKAEELVHFCSRDAMDIEGLGDGTVKALFKEALVYDPADLYNLKDKLVDIVSLEGFGNKKISKILKSVEASKSRSLERVLYALNIPYMGRTNSRAVASIYSSIDEISQASSEKLSQIEGIGQISAIAIYEWFRDEDNQRLINALKEAGINMTAPKVVKNSIQPLAGKSIVITGTLSQKRSDVENLIRINGGKTSGSVSKNTSFVILGEETGSSKHQKAIELGIPILSEEEFMKLISTTHHL